MRPNSDSSPVATSAGRPVEIDPTELLRRFHDLPGERLALLRQSAEVARSVGAGLYWVGGGVRDLALERTELDVDLVVDGDLAPFAEGLAAALGSELNAHPQFLTAELRAPDGVRIDLAQVRSESYAAPAALPQVAPGTLASDFGRRDFTINCLAIRLAPQFGDCLLDDHGGLSDLRHGQLRILHPASFRDDPTRILRGLEFAARFGFAIEPESLAAARSAIAAGVFAHLSPARLADALRRALGRPEGVTHVLRGMVGLELLQAIEPGLARAAGAAERLEAALLEPAAAGLDSTFRLALLGLGLDLPLAERERLALRLALPANDQEVLVGGPGRVRAAVAELAADLPPSAVHARLALLTDEELAFVSTAGAVARSWVRQERESLRKLRLRIGGRELIAAGERPGPTLGRALAKTLQARMDGEIEAADELRFALRVAAAERAEATQ
jgi:tRNA nucleotidyltransferase (CCA-adding enzyme)